MRSYVAFTQFGSAHGGAWPSCVAWCRAQILANPAAVAQIALARAGEKRVRVVAEVTSDCERRVRSGREVKLKEVRQWLEGH